MVDNVDDIGAMNVVGIVVDIFIIVAIMFVVMIVVIFVFVVDSVDKSRYQNIGFSCRIVYFQQSDHKNIDFPFVLFVFRTFRHSVWCVFTGFRQAGGTSCGRDPKMPKIAIFPRKYWGGLSGTICFPILFGPPERQIYIFPRK